MSAAVNNLMNNYVLGYSAWAGISLSAYFIVTGQTSRPDLLVLMPFITAGATQLSMKVVYMGITFFLDTLHAMVDPDIMLLMLSVMSLGMIVSVLYTCVRIVRSADSGKPAGLPTPSPEPTTVTTAPEPNVPESPPESEGEDSEHAESTGEESEQSGDSAALSGEEADAGADGDTEDNVDTSSEEEKN